MRSWPRRALAIGAACLLSLLAGSTVALPAPAAASQPGIATSELTAVPSDGVLHLDGHGFGHGHGLSQWGAQGAAESGVPLATVLAHFYPSATLTTSPASTIRVLLTGVSSGTVPLWAGSGLTVTGADGRATTPPADAAHARLRIVPAGGTALTLQTSPDGNHWVTETQSVTAPARVTDSAALIRVGEADGTSRSFHGSLTIGLSKGALVPVSVVALEDYTRDVIPRESPSGWLPVALQAQAIASRTYAVNAAQHAPSSQPYDICDSTACQVYGGATYYQASGGSGSSQETPNTDSATAATAGQTLTTGGRAAFTQFSASDGGWSTDGQQPYLPAVADPWDGVDPSNTSHTWTATVTATQLQQRFPAVGTLTALEVTHRDGYGEWGGRVTQVVLHGLSPSGAATAVTVAGSDVVAANPWPSSTTGLRSIWWHVTGAPVSVSAASTDPTTGAASAGPTAGAAGPTAAAAGAAAGFGLVPVTPRVVVSSASVAAAVPRRVIIAGRDGIPVGAPSVLVVASAGRLAGASVADLQAWAPGTPRGAAVRLVSLFSRGPASGSALVPLAADGSLQVAPSHGRLGLRLTVVGYAALAAPGLAPLLHPVNALSARVTGRRAVALQHPPAGANAALVAVTASGASGSLSLAGAQLLSLSQQPQTVSTLVPARSALLVSSGPATVRVQILGWSTPGTPGMSPALSRTSGRAGSVGGLLKLTSPAGTASHGSVPGAAHSVLALVTTTAPRAGTVSFWPHSTAGPGPLVADPAGRATTVLVAVPLRDGRLVVKPPAGPATLTVTVLGWS